MNEFEAGRRSQDRTTPVKVKLTKLGFALEHEGEILDDSQADFQGRYFYSKFKAQQRAANMNRLWGMSQDALKSGQTFSYFAIGAFFVVLTGAMLVGIGRNRSAQGGGGLYAAPALADGTPVATGAIPYGRGLYPWQRPAYERFGAFG